jgi:hypothetical protein
MTMRAGGHSALIVAAGLLVCIAGPSLAAAGGDETAAAQSETAEAPVKHSAHHWKKYAHHKPGKVALKSGAESNSKTGKPKIAATDKGDDNSSAILPSVANANAQMTAAEAPAGNASAVTARANDILQAAPDKPADGQPAADSQPASADQLNDADRALRDSAPPPPAPAVAMAAADTPVVAPATPVVAKANERSTLDQASLVGKVFIVFGALLTMASAVRMFMA